MLTVLLGGASMLGGLALIGFQLLLPAVPGQASQPPWLLIAAVGFLVLRGASEVATWWFRTYQVHSDKLVIDEGILTRHHRVVPFERVQQVDVDQPLVAQLLGLAALRIDTAGASGATRVQLRLLDRRHAEGLRTFVLERRAALQAARAGASSTSGASGAAHAGPADRGPLDGAPPPPVRQLLALGPGPLALSALAGPLGAVGAVLVVVGAFVALVVALSGDAPAIGIGSFVVALVLLVGVLTAVALSTVLSLWDLEVALAGDDLRLRHGLLQVRTLTLPRRRVQHVTVMDTPLQRLAGFVTITLHSAAGAHLADDAGRGNHTSFTVPYVPTRLLAGTLHDLLGGDWHLPPLARRCRAAERRAVVRRSALCLVLSLPALLLGPGGVLVVVAAGALGALWGVAAHHRAGWVETATLVALAHGALVHRLELVPVNRVQSARRSASPFQRRLDLATLHLDVAGRRAPLLYDLEGTEVQRLVRMTPRRGARLAR